MDELIVNLNNLSELIKYNKNLVDVIGDCPNLEMPVIPDNPFWKTIASKGNLICQTSLVTGKARVCNSDNVRLANGSKNAMLEKMQRLSTYDFLRPGDVIGISRNGLYEHYAIYLGNDRVIHYCGETKDFGGE